MTIAVATLLLALTAAPEPPRCAAVDVTATGQGAHGATPVPHSAAHRLIRALDRLPSWVASSNAVGRYRIVELRSASALNIIATRATSRLELEISAGELSLSDLRSALGPEVEANWSPRPCGMTPAGDEAAR